MLKSVVIKKFLRENRYVLHPNLIVKDSGSYAIAPYVIKYDLSTEELLNEILYVLNFSKEGSRPLEDSKVRHAAYLKFMGVKSMKELHDNSINLSLYVRDGILTFVPWENKGIQVGFDGFKEELNVRLSFSSSRLEEKVKNYFLNFSVCTLFKVKEYSKFRCYFLCRFANSVLL